MKYFSKWLILFIFAFVLGWAFVIWLAFVSDHVVTILAASLMLLFSIAYLGLYRTLKQKGIQTEVDISRVLGRDAKEALSFGDIGIITYNDEYTATWCSDYFKKHDINLQNRKLTSWIEEIREIFDGETDSIIARSGNQYYEISRKGDNKILYVKNVTQMMALSNSLEQDQIVIGLLTLDNYGEYQSYDNEEMLNRINSSLRGAIIQWAKVHNIFIRRIRSDRYLVVLDYSILMEIKKGNFSILQKIKDEADKLDVSITLSMVFAYGTNDFTCLDNMLNELLELVQSRGGDQVAIKKAKGSIEFIGGNSEKNSQRSKVRVGIIGSSIQDLIHESPKVFILGHVNSDYDCMGSALAASNWVRALGKEPYIVLKDVPRDQQLQQTMDHYKQALSARHTFVTEEEAMHLMDPAKDLVIMVDHGVPEISSGKNILDQTNRVVVIDHHRRGDHYVSAPLLTYVESQASSTVELISEMLGISNISVPIYEAEATIMYLGLLVDTNRFKQHTSERTFQAAAALKNWGANTSVAEEALQEDYGHFRLKNELVSRAVPYKEDFMISVAPQPLSRTMLSQVSDALLLIRGCKASFTIGINEDNGRVAVSARSDGSFNVQKIMEKMQGGGHFSAAALERADVTPQQILEELKARLDEEEAAASAAPDKPNK